MYSNLEQTLITRLRLFKEIDSSIPIDLELVKAKGWSTFKAFRVKNYRKLKGYGVKRFYLINDKLNVLGMNELEK